MSKLPIIKIFLLILLSYFFISCSDQNEENKKINITVTLPPYADYVKMIGGNLVEVNTIVPPGVNAHAFEITPQSMKNVIRTDHFFRVGPIFKFENILLEKISIEEEKIIDCSKGIEVINNNPHLWLSTTNTKIILRTISEELSRQYPGHQKSFSKNLIYASKKIDSVNVFIKTNILNKQNRTLLVYHPAWTYLANEYNLEQISIERDGKEPKARELKEIINIAKEKGVKCIFFDPHFDESSAVTIAKSLGLKIESLDPLPSNFIDNLKDIGSKLIEHIE